MYIASASSVVKFHNFPDTQLVHTYQPNCKVEGSCRSLSWTKDGSWLAVVPYSGCAEIVCLKDHQCKLLQTITDVVEPSCASFQNLTKRNVAIGTRHGQVLLYDMKSRGIKARYPRTSSAINHVGFTAKDTHCYVGCGNGDVLLFNNVAKNLSCTLKVPKSHSLTDVKAHAQRRNFLIGGSNEGIVCVWDVNVNKIKFQTDAHSGPVTSTIFSPSNSSLIVSAGLDRVVRVFDIENRSRITSIVVDNNALSLEFLENSLYIAVGCQNGKIHIYDTRTLQDPVHTLDSHKSAVRHITFQKSLDDGANNSSLVVGDGSLTKSSKSNEEVQSNRKRTSDFFGLVVDGPSSVSETFAGSKQPHLSSMEGGDSFIQALGLGKNNTVDSLKEEDIRPEEVVDSKPVIETTRKSINLHTPNPCRTIHEKLGLYDSRSQRQTTSTPVYPPQNFAGFVSPIVASNTNNQATLQGYNDITPDLQKVFQGEVKKALDEMETKLTYQFMNHAHQIRRMVLDLHMATLKEFIKVEDYCLLIRDEINADPIVSNRESYLLEENISLKRRIQELEAQIAGVEPRGDDGGND